MKLLLFLFALLCSGGVVVHATHAPTTPTTHTPTHSPSVSHPTTSPTTSHPTTSPTTSHPTTSPTVSHPTHSPSKTPTKSPSISHPTTSPTHPPTKSPTNTPTHHPTAFATYSTFPDSTLLPKLPFLHPLASVFDFSSFAQSSALSMTGQTLALGVQSVDNATANVFFYQKVTSGSSVEWTPAGFGSVSVYSGQALVPNGLSLALSGDGNTCILASQRILTDSSTAVCISGFVQPYPSVWVNAYSNACFIDNVTYPLSSPLRVSYNGSWVLIVSSHSVDIPYIFPTGTTSYSIVPYWMASYDPEYEPDVLRYTGSMSSNGKVVVVATPLFPDEIGWIQVFGFNDTTSEFTNTSSVITQNLVGVRQGITIALAGNGKTFVCSGVNATNHTQTGFIWTYDYNATSHLWVASSSVIRPSQLVASAAGYPLQLNEDGTVLVASSAGLSTQNVTIYTRTNGVWAVAQTLTSAPTSFVVPNSVQLSSDASTLVTGSFHASVGMLDTYLASSNQWSASTTVPLTTQSLTFDLSKPSTGYSACASTNSQTIILGAPNYDSNHGAAIVYEWNSTDWVTKGSILNGSATNSFVGNAVALSGDGNILAVSGVLLAQGNTSIIQVYEWNATKKDWYMTASLNLVDEYEAFQDYNGHELILSVDGSTMAFSTTEDDGLMFVYQRNATSKTWSSPFRITPGYIVNAMALSGDGSTLQACLSNSDTNLGIGCVVYVKNSLLTWTQQSLPLLGQITTGYEYETAPDQGYAVATTYDGSMLVMNNAQHGIWTFLRFQTSWTQAGNMLRSYIDVEDEFELTLSSDGSILLSVDSQYLQAYRFSFSKRHWTFVQAFDVSRLGPVLGLISADTTQIQIVPQLVNVQTGAVLSFSAFSTSSPTSSAALVSLSTFCLLGSTLLIVAVSVL